jgi:hypothetical protein
MEIDCVALVRSRLCSARLLLTASAAAYSTAGFFTRLIAVDAWTLLFWRGLFGGSFLAVVVAVQERGRLWRSIRAMGWEGAAGRGLLGGGDGVLPQRHAPHRRRRRDGDRCGHSLRHRGDGVADPGRARERLDAGRHGRRLHRHGVMAGPAVVHGQSPAMRWPSPWRS